jgi:SAM-dependent methyltransferase
MSESVASLDVDSRMLAMGKRWRSLLKAPRPAVAPEVRAKLERVNAMTAVPIELASHHVPPVAKGDLDATGGSRVRKEFLREVHHQQYGRPWAAGRYIFEYLIAAGLLPQHRLLDFGCGSLRVGIWAIPYLEFGNYFGVESHLASLEAATTYEIPLHGLEERRPRLLWNDRFEFEHFGASFDCILDFSSSIFVKDPARLFRQFGRALAPNGRLFTGPTLPLSTEEIAKNGLTLVRERVVQDCPLLQGHEELFQSFNEWWEFRRV